MHHQMAKPEWKWKGQADISSQNAKIPETTKGFDSANWSERERVGSLGRSGIIGERQACLYYSISYSVIKQCHECSTKQSISAVHVNHVLRREYVRCPYSGFKLIHVQIQINQSVWTGGQ